MLSNFIFKVVTKITTTRLGSRFTSQVLVPNQFSFVPGRNIHHYIALVSKEINSMNRKKVEGQMALKVNIKKAFDRIEWPFLL